MLEVTGTNNASLRYDPMGRLYEVVDHDAQETTLFLYSGDSVIAEYRNGVMTNRYVHGRWRPTGTAGELRGGRR